MKKILVTGATGFVGKAIVSELMTGGGCELYTTGRREKAELPNYFSVDLAAEESAAELAGKLPPELDCVVHSAGLAHQFDGAKDPDIFTAVNAGGTRLAAALAAKKHCQKFVLISSISVYGDDKTPLTDEDAKCQPDGEYGASKYEAEIEAERVCRENNISLTILRLATVYGPNDVGNVLRLVKLIDSGRFFWTGKGDNAKSLVFSEDVARAVRLAVDAEGPVSGKYNVTDAPHTMREIVETIAKELGRRAPKFSVPPSLIGAGLKTASYLPFVGPSAKRFERSLEKWLSDDVVSGEKIERELNFKPSVSLAEGIKREIEWYRKNK
jgi:nucleoside-diphosphate-sugar epimerase